MKCHIRVHQLSKDIPRLEGPNCRLDGVAFTRKQSGRRAIQPRNRHLRRIQPRDRVRGRKLDDCHRSLSGDAAHQSAALTDDGEGVFQTEGAGDVGRGNLSNAAAHHGAWPDSPGAPHGAEPETHDD
jgi:hypothetical protein